MVTLTVNRSSLERVVSEFALLKCGELGDAFVEGAQGRTSRRTFELHDSIEHDDPELAGERAQCLVRAGAEHARYQDEGTGIYGPTGQRITPNDPDGVLAFDWPAAGGQVFYRSVAGAPGTHFWTETVEDWPNIVRSV